MIIDKDFEGDDASEEAFEVEESGNYPRSVTRTVYHSMEVGRPTFKKDGENHLPCKY